MASLTSQLRVTMKDDVSGPAKAAAAALKGVGASAKDLDKLSKIDAFRATQKSFAASREAFRAAQDNVRKLSREMSAAETPTRRVSAARASGDRRGWQAVKMRPSSSSPRSSSIAASIDAAAFSDVALTV